MKKNSYKLDNAFHAVKTRIREPVIWYPFPALISFALVVLLLGLLLPGLNPRLHNRANIIEFPATRQRDGAIWLSVYLKNNMIVLRTSDNNYFSWPIDTDSGAPLKRFEAYLEMRKKKEAFAVGLKVGADYTNNSVVLSVDQRLKYIHVSPIVYSLAKANITHYGFETKILK